MGQKSRSKKQKISHSKNMQRAQASAVPQDAAPSLVSTSAGFKPAAAGTTRTVASEDLLQVRSSDIRRIAVLLGVMAVLLVALEIVSVKSTALQATGAHLSHWMRI